MGSSRAVGRPGPLTTAWVSELERLRRLPAACTTVRSRNPPSACAAATPPPTIVAPDDSTRPGGRTARTSIRLNVTGMNRRHRREAWRSAPLFRSTFVRLRTVPLDVPREPAG